MGDKLVLQIPFFLCICLNYSVDSIDKHSGGLEVITIVVSKQFYFIIKLTLLVKSFHGLILIRILNLIVESNPRTIMILFYELPYLSSVVMIRRVDGVDWE